MRLYLPRCYVRDLKSNLAAFERDVRQAAQLNCDAALFPEQFLTGYYGEGEPAMLRQQFSAASKEQARMLLGCGTITEDKFNRQLLYLGGAEVASYNKVHLFLPNGEADIWERGNAYVAYSWGEWRIGLITCNDIRFPEQVRELKLKYDINLLFCPALWPWGRDQIWAALLRARAIENGIFVVGSCVAGVDNGSQLFDGAGNHVYDPLGNELFPAERSYELDPARLEQVLVDTCAQHFQIDNVELN